ncbi:hypothetical protein [Pseudoteredinibacter isoporae]|uniref:Prenyltransferase beta subunit n=1 Tax=Pseudoteredinibacter isoporae TaxID=570281 RepID=A0A7X0MU96_9GAMM|nr:hypothetical protein [Pseudoteredinibacter isoporae]MBB6520038.1 prenyltransferase beta subunit [Pseudoteredinibacter isoporae]NHO85610.1 hypothetical protein [Pseudoteredinibacter isoporae]NIB25938.1 hypothetical protein [Pseudoteredinibacter isoporae]
MSDKPHQPGSITMPAELKALYNKLDAIFGIPKTTLNAEEQAREKQISDAIEKIMESSGEGELNFQQETELATQYDALDKLYGVRSYESLSIDEKSQVNKIYQQIEAYYDEHPEARFDEDISFDDLDFTLLNKDVNTLTSFDFPAELAG